MGAPNINAPIIGKCNFDIPFFDRTSFLHNLKTSDLSYLSPEISQLAEEIFSEDRLKDESGLAEDEQFMRVYCLWLRVLEAEFPLIRYLSPAQAAFAGLNCLL